MQTETEDETAISTFVGPEPAELDERLEEDLKDFSDLLGSIDGTNSKLKSLWKLIFENANIDRKNAYIIFVDLYIKCHGNADNHAIHGPNLAKYLERMEKANAQLLKLAELVDKSIIANKIKEEDDDEEIDTSSKSIFSKIQQNKEKK